MSVFLILTAVCGTGCSDTETEISSSLVCVEGFQKQWEYYGTVAFDDKVSSKVFTAEDELTKDVYRVFLPDTLQSTAEGEHWLRWAEPISIINVNGIEYICPNFAFIVPYSWVPQKSRNSDNQSVFRNESDKLHLTDSLE